MILEFWKQSKRGALRGQERKTFATPTMESSTERVLVERLRWTAEKSLYVDDDVGHHGGGVCV